MKNQMYSKYFSREELVCKCCNKIGGSPLNLLLLTTRLDKLRELNKAPIYVTNAYRCIKHNKEVGGVENSYHTQCLAADIYAEGVPLLRLALLARKAGFRGIGVYYNQRFVHVDMGREEKLWVE